MVNLDYLYNPDAAKPKFDKNYFLDKKLGFQVIENGMILPHKDMRTPGKWHFGLVGIVDSENKYVNSSSVHYGVGGAYTPPPESIQYRAETVIYLFLLYPVWGHCLTDNLRRLWFLKSDTFKNEFKNCPLVYVSWGKQNLETYQNFKRLLEILEVDVDRLQEITQPTRFEKIILPDDSFSSPHSEVRGFTNEYLEAIDSLRHFALKNRTPTFNKKIYFFSGRKGIGENRIAEYLRSKGYEVISPEKLTLDEQLNILINCENFGSVSNSCSHNLLFLRDGMEMILIPRAASELDYYQEVLNQVHPLNINYVDSSLSIFSRGITSGGHFYIISPQLKRFFGDKWNGYEEEDLKTFLQYVKDSKGLDVNPNTWTYYNKTFPEFMEQLKRRKDLIEACNMPPDWEKFQPAGFCYQTHISGKGWGNWNSANQISNSLEDKLDIQAIIINFTSHRIYYSVYYNDKEGWSKEVTFPEIAGTTGKSKPIMGIRILLDETGAKETDILYRVHKFDGQWTDWAKNGEVIYSHGQKINAVQIKLESKSKS